MVLMKPKKIPSGKYSSYGARRHMGGLGIDGVSLCVFCLVCSFPVSPYFTTIAHVGMAARDVFPKIKSLHSLRPIAG